MDGVDGSGGFEGETFGRHQLLEVLRSGSTGTVYKSVGHPDFVAVDAGGNVYLTDTADNRVIKLVKATTTSIMLPFNGLNHPQGIAVDPAENVYVVDTGNNRVPKLPPS